MPFFAHALFATFGSAGRLGAANAQCTDHDAPCSIHCLTRAICSALSFLPLVGGGIISDALCELMRENSSLSWGLPGTMATPPRFSLANAPSLVSSRSFALRDFSSGPWQAKQLSDKIGRMWRLKSMAGVADRFAVTPGSPKAGVATTRARNTATRRIDSIGVLMSRITLR